MQALSTNYTEEGAGMGICPICKINYITEEETVCSTCVGESELSEEELDALYGGINVEKEIDPEDDIDDDEDDDDMILELEEEELDDDLDLDDEEEESDPLDDFDDNLDDILDDDDDK